MYKIGELSKLCRLPVKTLRYYDKERLLLPDKVDQFTGYRYYSAAKLADCNRILALKELGFTLDEIRTHLQAEKQEDILALIQSKQTELQDVAMQTESQIRRLEAIKQIITEGENTMFNVVIQSSASIHVAALRKIYPTKENAFAELEKMKQTLSPTILGERSVLINYETEHRENDFDLCICVEITEKLPKESGFIEKNIIFHTDVASLVCKKGESGEAYLTMIRQLEEIPAQIIGAFYEIYHDDGTVELKVPVYKLCKKNVLDDAISLPFVNDMDAVGKWKLLDIVPSEEQFLYGHEKCGHSGWLDTLYFLENGEPYWVVGGWTKGYLYMRSNHVFKNKYTIEKQDNRSLLFLEMKHFKDGGEERMEHPQIWVYEKCSDALYHASDIRLRDNTDIPFVLDNTILGTWNVRDFYVEKESFDSTKQNWCPDDLFFLKVEFLSDGTCIHTTKHQESQLLWTQGKLLNKVSETASAYEMERVDGKEYLWVEWKTGDYQFGGGRIYWYVFMRA